jgi:hypothetical protein
MMPFGGKCAAGTAVLLAAGLLLAAEPAPADYAAGIQKWREERETRLKSDGGWLTVAGLFWLKEGPNRFGSDHSDDVVLPPGTSPAFAGVFELQNGKVSVKVESGTSVTHSGRTVTEMELKSDTSGEPTELALGDLTLFVIDRGGKYGIRLKDKNSKMRKEFTGLKWYPVKPGYRITADWTDYSPPKQIPVPNVLGQSDNLPSPGFDGAGP